MTFIPASVRMFREKSLYLIFRLKVHNNHINTATRCRSCCRLGRTYLYNWHVLSIQYPVYITSNTSLTNYGVVSSISDYPVIELLGWVLNWQPKLSFCILNENRGMGGVLKLLNKFSLSVSFSDLRIYRRNPNGLRVSNCNQEL